MSANPVVIDDVSVIAGLNVDGISIKVTVQADHVGQVRIASDDVCVAVQFKVGTAVSILWVIPWSHKCRSDVLWITKKWNSFTQVDVQIPADHDVVQIHMINIVAADVIEVAANRRALFVIGIVTVECACVGEERLNAFNAGVYREVAADCQKRIQRNWGQEVSENEIIDADVCKVATDRSKILTIENGVEALSQINGEVALNGWRVTDRRSPEYVLYTVTSGNCEITSENVWLEEREVGSGQQNVARPVSGIDEHATVMQEVGLEIQLVGSVIQQFNNDVFGRYKFQCSRIVGDSPSVVNSVVVHNDVAIVKGLFECQRHTIEKADECQAAFIFQLFKLAKWSITQNVTILT